MRGFSFVTAALALGLAATSVSAQPSPSGVDLKAAFDEKPEAVAERMIAMANCSWRNNYKAALAFADRAEAGLRSGEFNTLWNSATVGCSGVSSSGVAIDVQAYADALVAQRAQATAHCFQSANLAEYEGFKLRLWNATQLEASRFHFGSPAEAAPASLKQCDPSIVSTGKIYKNRRWELMAYFWRLPGSPVKETSEHARSAN